MTSRCQFGGGLRYGSQPDFERPRGRGLSGLFVSPLRYNLSHLGCGAGSGETLENVVPISASANTARFHWAGPLRRLFFDPAADRRRRGAANVSAKETAEATPDEDAPPD